MKDDTFQELLQGVREGGAYLRGELKPARTIRVRIPARPKTVSPKNSAGNRAAPRRVRIA